MGDKGAGQPAARAYHQPAASRESSVSGAKLISPRPSAVSVPPTASGAVAIAREDSSRLPSDPPLQQGVNGDWGKLATAPTLLLRPRDEGHADADSTSRIETAVATDFADSGSTSRIETPFEKASDDAASTSRIETTPARSFDDTASTSRIETPGPSPAVVSVSPSMMPPGDPGWFRSGNTVPPPSMRPSADSLSPPPVRKPRDPRVTKIVGGVIAVCLFIVTIAGIKIWSHRGRAPQATPASETKTGSTNGPADDAKLAAAAQLAAAAALPPAAPEVPAVNNAENVGANGSEAAPGTANKAAAAPARAASRPAPVRVPTKPATHRAPPKKVRR